MTCQRCPEEASVHLTESVNGRRTEIHLCASCARESGLTIPEAPPILPLDAVVQNLIISHVGELVGELANLTCPYCGLKFMEFRTKGRLGCPNDFEAFSRGLGPLLIRAHGATRHVGKAPGRSTLDADRARLRLRSEFRAAISRENYEQAARLRDQLRSKDVD